jgi:transposase
MPSFFVWTRSPRSRSGATAALVAQGPWAARARHGDVQPPGDDEPFEALDVATGKVIGERYSRKRAVEFRRFLNVVDAQAPVELDVHPVVDNSSFHAAPEIRRWLRHYSRFHLHFTPTYSSWLNLIERWFAKLTEEALRRGSHQSTRERRTAIDHYIGASAWDSCWTHAACGGSEFRGPPTGVDGRVADGGRVDSSPNICNCPDSVRAMEAGDEPGAMTRVSTRTNSRWRAAVVTLRSLWQTRRGPAGLGCALGQQSDRLQDAGVCSTRRLACDGMLLAARLRVRRHPFLWLT